MKHLIIASVVSLMAGPFLGSASASPELAKEWGIEAGSLYQQTRDLMSDIDMGGVAEPSDDYIFAVQRFASTSSGLAIWIDTSDGPKDLGCIFRGMSAEAETQIASLDAPFDPLTTRDKLARLLTMFSDAEMIAAAAARRSPTPTLDTGVQTEVCPAELEAAMRALK